LLDDGWRRGRFGSRLCNFGPGGFRLIPHPSDRLFDQTHVFTKERMA
jgi:hypothetical protein